VSLIPLVGFNKTPTETTEKAAESTEASFLARKWSRGGRKESPLGGKEGREIPVRGEGKGAKARKLDFGS